MHDEQYYDCGAVLVSYSYSTRRCLRGCGCGGNVPHGEPKHTVTRTKCLGVEEKPVS